MIEEAQIKHASEFCNVLRESIVELCEEDHRNDSVKLDAWLKNKTVENCKDWIADNESCAFVAMEKGKVVGISLIGKNGHLFLCYLLSKVKGRGIGKLLLKAAESKALYWGVNEITLESTVTAKEFYLYNGYTKNGSCSSREGLSCYPLKKVVKS